MLPFVMPCTGSGVRALLVLLLTCAACSADPGPEVRDAAVDASIDAFRDTGTDLGGNDLGADAPTMDATMPEIDASFACSVAPGPAPCDGMSRLICSGWAQRTGAAWSEPVSTCVQDATDGCARADLCDDPSDITTCHCGAGSRCGPGEVCARERLGEVRRCLRCTAD